MWLFCLTVKPNWIGPRATIKTQAKTEMELSRMTWDDSNMLDCLEPIRYQLPVCKNGRRRSFLPSSVSSLKLIFLLSFLLKKFLIFWEESFYMGKYKNNEAFFSTKFWFRGIIWWEMSSLLFSFLLFCFVKNLCRRLWANAWRDADSFGVFDLTDTSPLILL